MKLGFSENEARTYLELLKIGGTTTTTLAKKLNLHRGYIYEILDKLIQKGIVSVIKKNGKKHFEAVPPSKIFGYIEDQTIKLEKSKKDFEKILPALNNLRELSKKGQEVLLFEGKKALMNIMNDIILQKKPIFTFGASGKFPKEMDSYYFLWNKQRVKNKISLQIVYNKKEIGQLEASHLENAYVEKRYLDFDKDNPMSTMLYADKVVIIIWIQEPVILLIESKEGYNLYKKYFDVFWKSAKKI